MTVRSVLMEKLNEAKEVMGSARETLDMYNRQEPQTDREHYSLAQHSLEQTYLELQKLSLSANAQQREEIHRAIGQILELQQDMILDDIDLQRS